MSRRCPNWATSGLAQLIRILVFLLLAAVAVAAAAQPTPRPPVAGPTTIPGADAARRDLWQMLTLEQREYLWRSLTAEQRTDIWRGLEPHERREMRERLAPADADGGLRPLGPRRPFDTVDGPPRAMMTPEERQQMREQIREAHRLRRERTEVERRPGTP